MNDTLFDLPVTLSPRLQWMEKHRIKAHATESTIPGMEWCAGNGTYCEFESNEIYAVTKLAETLAIHLWNEETL